MMKYMGVTRAWKRASEVRAGKREREKSVV